MIQNRTATPSDFEQTAERLVPGQGLAWDLAIHMARYRFAAQFVPGKRVLDCACGVGYGSVILAEAGARFTLGVDLASEAASYTPGKKTLAFAVQNAERLGLQRQTIDVVVSFETIEHLDSAPQFIREVARVLRPGGLFIASVPNRAAIDSSATGNARFSPFHRHEFDLVEFRSLLTPLFDDIAFLYQLCPDRKVARARQAHRVLRQGRLVGLKRLLPVPILRLVRFLLDRWGDWENRRVAAEYYAPHPLQSSVPAEDAFVLIALSRNRIQTE